MKRLWLSLMLAAGGAALAETPKSNPTADDPFLWEGSYARPAPGFVSVALEAADPHLAVTLIDVAMATAFDSDAEIGTVIYVF